MNTFVLVISIIFSNGQSGTLVSNYTYTEEYCHTLALASKQELKKIYPDAITTYVCVEEDNEASN